MALRGRIHSLVFARRSQAPESLYHERPVLQRPADPQTGGDLPRRHRRGAGSTAVPGVVAGREEAHRRHANVAGKEWVSRGVGLAGEGLLVDWWPTRMIAGSAVDLRRYPASAAAYLHDGLPPDAKWGI